MCAACAQIVFCWGTTPPFATFSQGRLEQAGFEAWQAEYGIYGLVKRRDELPRVIVCDLEMSRLPLYRLQGALTIPDRNLRARVRRPADRLRDRAYGDT